MAGTLLQFLPVAQTYDEDVETGDTEYIRFLARHTPTRADGRWLADRRDAPPQRVELLTESGTTSRGPGDEWVFQISSEMFYRELHPDPDWFNVSSSRSVQDFGRDESVHVNSALVPPGTAHALLRALQTAPDWQAYRIPDTNDYEYSSAIAGFELTGWIEPHGYSEGLDAKDPNGVGVSYPPERPSTTMPGLDDLTPDNDMRLWRDQDGRVTFISRVWDESDGGTNSQASSGYELLTERASLGARLRRLDRWLIVEVGIRRHVSPSRTYDTPRGDDERLGYLQPSTKYFLTDFAGEVHDL